MFQVLIRPGSYGIGQETVGATQQGRQIDPDMPNSELECCTSDADAITIGALLVHLSTIPHI